MKTEQQFLKMSLMGLFLMLSTVIYAQVTPNPETPVTVNADLKTGMLNDLGAAALNADAVMFFNPTNGGTTFTLTASDMDEAGENTFTDYAWYPIDTDGVANTTTSLSAIKTLELTNLQPGYHRFRVYGFVSTPGVNCQSDEYQDMIVFILNPLNPTAEAAAAAIAEFCQGDTGTFDLTANVDFSGTYENADFPNPTAAEMDMTYTWYAMYNDGTTTVRRNLGTTSTTQAGGTHTITVENSEVNDIGTYTFHVEVAYSSGIKDKEGRGEGHGFWTAQVGGTTNPYTLTVTPKPGRPTITIGSVVD